MRLRFSFLVTVAVAACGPSGSATLDVSVTPSPMVYDGSEARVRVAATDELGLVGKGAVRVTSSAGSLASGVDLPLDAYGTARVALACDAAVEPACKGSVRVSVEWKHGKDTVTGEVGVHLTNRAGQATYTGASGDGAGGGGGGGGGRSFCGECTAPSSFVFRASHTSGAPLLLWGSSATNLTDSSVTGTATAVDLSRTDCVGTTCTKVVLTALSMTLAASGGPAVDAAGLSSEWLAAGGSMDSPVLSVGSYADGKRNPPVSSQPYFDTTLCGGAANITAFQVCSLVVVDGRVVSATLGFASNCFGINRRVEGCIAYHQ